jgi:3D (Asp-Asp-Asp) domain-containing protein
LFELKITKEDVLRKKSIVVPIVLFCFLGFVTTKQLVNASYCPNTKPAPPTSTFEKINAKNAKVIKRMNVRVTAYYGPLRGQKKYVLGSFKKDVRMNGAGKTTRSGTAPRISTAAADWRVLPPGTQFRIIGCPVQLGTNYPQPTSNLIFEVEDTGSAVKGRHIDIFTGFGDYGRETAEKINNGRKHYVIELIKCEED